MFGKPQWFRAKSIGWGLIPVCWQGWAYTAGWAGAAALPFLLLLSRHQPVEAIVWLGVLFGGLAIDVRQIRGTLQREKHEGATPAQSPRRPQQAGNYYVAGNRGQ